MTPKGWTKHSSGLTQVFPVTGWRAAPAMKGQVGALRIEFATDPTMQKRDAKQFIMTATQLRALSETLIKLADKLDGEAQDIPDGPVN